MLEERALDVGVHNRSGFDCGVPDLNDYLKRLAEQHRRKGVSTPFVLVDTDAPTAILGYYCLSAAQVDAAELRDKDRQKLPCYPVPCFRLGRLAIRKDRHGQGIGKLLLACAVDRCLKARSDVAAYALIVDAKDENARQFYEHCGFVAFAGEPMTLYLGLGG
ncbi:MAG: GNAT family N-acetyltransferase [Gammaproteobacteria bacterium]|nr:GNAT family N-acetyltransferase [Gammaproteobacteria bacterium]